MRYAAEPRDPDEFDVKRTDYTPAELEAFATGWLMRDRKGAESLSDLGKKITLYLEEHKRASLYELRRLGKPMDIIREVANLVELERLNVKRDRDDTRDIYSLAPHEEANWLTEDQIAYRKSGEIYSTTGEIDPAYVSGMYWRAYPNGGRKLYKRTDENRKAKRGFYGRRSFDQ
ncbi:MAG: hypothetical protein JSS68_14945 [Actinobacteria bacterium]|nr:hypothetical protein [Actinomycetota bacterium]